MSIYLFLQVLLTLVISAYAMFMLWLAYAVIALQHPPFGKCNKQPVSIVIPFFNDEQYASVLLRSLYNIEYPAHLMEIILVNDHSRAAALKRWHTLVKDYPQLPVKIMDNPQAPGKKNALHAGVMAARNALVLQTDADTCPEPQWVEAFVQSMAGASPVVLGLVKMYGKGLWGRLAALDFLSLQASGFAMAHWQKPIMANGASLAFKRDIWLQSPYSKQEPASGDDTFMVQRLAKKYPVSYALLAGVATPAPERYIYFIRQRLRWGAKSIRYPEPFGKWVALLVALGNIAVVIAVIATALAVLSWPYLASLWLAKIFAEAMVLIPFASKTAQFPLLKLLPVSLLLYPFYTLHIVLLMLFRKRGKWKGRGIALRGTP